MFNGIILFGDFKFSMFWIISLCYLFENIRVIGLNRLYKMSIISDILCVIYGIIFRCLLVILKYKYGNMYIKNFVDISVII